MSVRVSGIIVTFDNEQQVDGCVDSLLEDLPGDSEVLVVDNASDDATVRRLERRGESIRLLRSEENLGFGRAVNLAARSARGDFLLLVNPDTVLAPGTVASLLELADRRPDAGLYGGRTIHADGSPGLDGCWALPSLWSLFCFATGLSSALPRSRFDPESLGRWNRDTERDVGMVTGVLLLVRRELWDRLEGFDEDFFMYSEDADLALRARTLGYRPRITPSAVVEHEGGGSSGQSGRKVAMMLAGRVTFIRKHWSPPARLAGRALLVCGVALRAVLGAPAWREAWRTRARWASGWASSPRGSTRTITDPSSANRLGRFSQALHRTQGMSRLRSILLPASGDPKEIIKTLRPTVAARKLAWRRDWLLFGRAVHARERPALTRLGSGYGGWVVPEDLIEGDWVVYSAGIGTDTSFDEALIARFGTDVFGFDPIDTAASHAREVVARQPRFHFRQVAVWSEDGEIDLFAPEDESHTSFSISDMQHTDRAVRTPARRLSTLMDELGHDRIDLLKLDVEGAEYAVLDDLLKGGLRPPVLCVEYHRTTTMEHMIGGVRRAEAAGYRVVHVHRSDVTFVHVDRF